MLARPGAEPQRRGQVEPRGGPLHLKDQAAEPADAHGFFREPKRVFELFGACQQERPGPAAQEGAQAAEIGQAGFPQGFSRGDPEDRRCRLGKAQAGQGQSETSRRGGVARFRTEKFEQRRIRHAAAQSAVEAWGPGRNRVPAAGPAVPAQGHGVCGQGGAKRRKNK